PDVDASLDDFPRERIRERRAVAPGRSGLGRRNNVDLVVPNVTRARDESRRPTHPVVAFSYWIMAKGDHRRERRPREFVLGCAIGGTDAFLFPARVDLTNALNFGVVGLYDWKRLLARRSVPGRAFDRGAARPLALHAARRLDGDAQGGVPLFGGAVGGVE